MKNYLLFLLTCVGALLHAAPDYSTLPLVLSYDHVEVRSSATEWAILTRESEPQTLAYGEGQLNAETLPPEFTYMVERYNASQATHSSRANHAPRRVEARDVATLVPSRWGQGYPFYNLCPKDQATGYICKTGCVATATAQVLYYHRRQGEKAGKKYMESLIGYKMYSFTDSKGNHVRVGLNLGNTTLNWAKMCDTYVSNTEEERAAVSKLMFACGVAASMIYGPNVSLADPSVCAAGINASFCGMTARMANFSEDLIRSEIIAGRPVIYSGNDGNGNAHAFVLDGMQSNGYIHCNMGYNGAGDGYYSISNLGNFPNPQNLLLIAPTDADKPSITPVSGLNGSYYAQAATTAATSIETGKWYVLWNSGRGGAPMSSGTGSTIYNAGIMPGNEMVKYTAAQMVRFVARSAGGYYIQTGRGDYLGNFSGSQGATAFTTGGQTAWFAVENIASGYFALKSMGQRYIDTNGPGGTVVGWSTTKPTDIYSNSSWMLFPVNMQATPFSKDDTGGNVISDAWFDGGKIYTLRNAGVSGSSEAYLVSTSESDTHPTLAGATRAVGGNAYYSRYAAAWDPYNVGSYWRLEPSGSNGSNWYLKNMLTGKYLGCTSSTASDYIYKNGKNTLVVTKRSDGTFAFIDASVKTDDKGYLCATTNRENPAGYWTNTDAGAYWKVEEVSGIPVRTIDGSEFNSTKKYTLRNVNGGGGYLVALLSSDAAPTLRGANTGLDTYKVQEDLSDLGTYWTITHDTQGIYVQNCLTKTYLTNTGSRTNYELSAIKVPLKMGHPEGKSTFWINSTALDDLSYMCARPNESHAISYGNRYEDAAQWTITEGTPIQRIPPTSITLDKTSMTLLVGQSDRITATIAPSNATSKSITWSSSDPTVATVDATGEVHAISTGTTEIRGTSVVSPTLYSSCALTVVGAGSITDVVSTHDEEWQSGRQYQLYNNATGKYLIAQQSGSTYTLQTAANATISDANTYWLLEANGSSWTLKNVGCNLYLSGGASGAAYSLSTTEATLSAITMTSGIHLRDTRYYNNYLSASTLTGVSGANSEPMLGWVFKWTNSNVGPGPGPGPEPEPEGDSYTIRLKDTQLYFTTKIVQDVNFTTYSLSAEAEDFILSPVEGTTNGFHITSTNGTHVGHTTINSWDFCNEASTWYIANTEGQPTTIYKNSYEGFGVNASEPEAGVFTDKRGQYWIVEPHRAVGILRPAAPTSSSTYINVQLNPFISIEGGKKIFTK